MFCRCREHIPPERGGETDGEGSVTDGAVVFRRVQQLKRDKHECGSQVVVRRGGRSSLHQQCGFLFSGQRGVARPVDFTQGEDAG